MGKRKGKGGLTGLSKFALEAFKNDPESQPIGTTTQDQQTSPSRPSHEIENQEYNHPQKRRKTETEASTHTETLDDGGGWIEQWVEKYDATGLVPHYSRASEVPDHLKKYFSQRTRFFSLYSTPPGCLLDEEGWYSVTPELVADQIAERCRCDTVLDAFCGVGGNTIAFAKTCQRVIALDTSPTRLALARHNAQIYGVADRIEFILSDYVSFAHSYLSRYTATSPPDNDRRRIDVVFLSPPWGGPSYLSGTVNQNTPLPIQNTDNNALIDGKDEAGSIETHPSYSLSSIQPIHGADLFRLSRRITQNIAYYLPRNTRLEEVSNLLHSSANSLGIPESTTQIGKGKQKEEEPEYIEVEEEWMGTKLKALTCYFGGLVNGQGHLY